MPHTAATICTPVVQTKSGWDIHQISLTLLNLTQDQSCCSRLRCTKLHPRFKTMTVGSHTLADLLRMFREAWYKIETETENYFCVGTWLQSLLWEMSIYSNLIIFTYHVTLSSVKVLEIKLSLCITLVSFLCFLKLIIEPSLDRNQNDSHSMKATYCVLWNP